LGTKVIETESWGKRSQYPKGFGLGNRTRYFLHLYKKNQKRARQILK